MARFDVAVSKLSIMTTLGLLSKKLGGRNIVPTTLRPRALFCLHRFQVNGEIAEYQALNHQLHIDIHVKICAHTFSQKLH